MRLARGAGTLLLLLTYTVLKPSDGQSEGQTSLDHALRALEKAVGFFRRNYDGFNMDGMFGLRVAQGQLMDALNFTQHHLADQLVLEERLAYLISASDESVRLALPYMAQQAPRYFRIFEPFIAVPVLVDNPPRTAHVLPMDNSVNMSNYDEREGDKCFARLMGTDGAYEDVEESSPKCTIDEPCRKMMTDEGLNKYKITHQVLFFIMGQQLGCDKELQRAAGGESLAAFYQQRCDQIYTEANLSTRGGDLVDVTLPTLDHNQDLFMEQAVVCGLVGFKNFLNKPWLELILHWQEQSGCFGHVTSETGTRSGRRLLMELELADGCFSHKSGLGTAVLGLYVNFLIQNHGEFPEDLQ